MLAADGVTVMASPDVFAPFCRAPKQAITLHDIIPLRCPHLLNRSAKGRFSFAWRQWLRLQVGAADCVLTVSDHARADIASAFKGSEEKLRTVYNAAPVGNGRCGPNATPGDGVARLLYVGRTAPYKNITGCIQALAKLRNEGVDATLTIVGEPDPRYPEAQHLADRLGLGNAVAFTGHIDDQQLQALYRSASVFLFLSYYEGFGLPPLEAMAHGVPVVSSDRSSMPEVLGDAALLVDPDDTAAAASAIQRVLSEPDLAADLRERGQARAKTFSVDLQATMFWNAVSPLLDPVG
jgi:glycosyltransferase involved in cell wall biosynthesis